MSNQREETNHQEAKNHKFKTQIQTEKERRTIK